MNSRGELAQHHAPHAVPSSRTIAGPGQEIGLAQEAEMLRDRRLSQLELVDYLLGDMGATLDELLENPNSRRMCQRFGYRSYPRFAERSRSG